MRPIAPLRQEFTMFNDFADSDNQAEMPADQMIEIAEDVLAELPPLFRDKLRGLSIRVEDEADRATLRMMGIDHPLNLLGLYHGVSLIRASTHDLPRTPDSIRLFRRPILAHAIRKNETPAAVIRHVLIHEIGHHFGYSDDEMDAIDNGA